MHNVITVSSSSAQRYDESKRPEESPSKPIKTSRMVMASASTQSSQTTRKLQKAIPSKAENRVLRQPRRSEMAYFGVPVSPQITRRAEKKDLRTERRDLRTEQKDLQIEKIAELKPRPQTRDLKTDNRDLRTGPKDLRLEKKDSRMENTYSRVPNKSLQTQNNGLAAKYSDSQTENKDLRLENKNSRIEKIYLRMDKEDLRTKSLESKKNKSESKTPIYENVEEAKRGKYHAKREFDASILDELTKAADEILQAVNGYADDRCTTDEDKSKSSIKEPLETISESKSWKRTSAKKRTPSNSSVENLSKERQSSKSTSSVERKKKDATKARRLQRASSREVLLQSHGSSSEDLAIEMPLRKPRLVKKSKSGTFTIPERSKDKKILPEIRHKTAISTIRSTAEKAKDVKKKPQKSKDAKMLISSTVPKSERPTRDGGSFQPHKEKISTANIKKCSRYDATKR